MNSASGVGAMIGLHSGKVLAYDSRKKKCRVCESAARKGVQAPQHDCRRNWDKSSKAMEPDVAASLAKGMAESGIKLGALTADNDAATIKRVREEVDSSVDKWVDLSHTKENFGSKLEAAKGQHKELKNSRVITKCFICCVKRNKNMPADLATALTAVPSHLFGHHSSCGDWRKAQKLTDPFSYKFSSFPRGKPLQSEAPRKFLQDLFDKQAGNAEKLAPRASSN